jgi:hypothetical protein
MGNWQGKDMEAPHEENEAATLVKQLEPFLKHNPYSQIQKKGERYHVVDPWGDESLSFVIEPDSRVDLIAALNNLVLPPRFTALYHLDSNAMEYIYTFLDRNSPYISRVFEFTIDGQTYHCQFGRASERLLLLSKVFTASGEESGTAYRNLRLLNMYTTYVQQKKLASGEEPSGSPIPTSFFVSGFEKFEEDKMVEVSKHLNFFMTYYDGGSPIIVIHSPRGDKLEPLRELLSLETEFPKKVSCSRKDPFLLDLALAAQGAKDRLQFLYYYQILEYAAFYYVDADIKRRMLQTIAAPDIQAYPDKYVYKLLDILSDIRQTDEARLNKVVEIGCSPDAVWRRVEQNLLYFSKRQEFDGGFVLEPFVSADASLEAFRGIWVPKTPDTLRKIRNALVHGRESRLGLVIAPTKANELKIQPWIRLIRCIAEQVLIFLG